MHVFPERPQEKGSFFRDILKKSCGPEASFHHSRGEYFTDFLRFIGTVLGVREVLSQAQS